MPEANAIPYFREIIVFLLAAAVIVPLFQRLKVTPVLGYLAAGAAIGPHGLALMDDNEGVRILADFGVVFLLFTIGLDLTFERLAAMRRLVFGLGFTQVVFTGAAIGLIAWAWGNGPEVSVVLGASLALSSTAVVMQLLIERGEVASRLGRVTFAVLLSQDLAVVPILFVVHAFGHASDSVGVAGVVRATGTAVVAVAAIFVFGRLFLRPLFKLVSGTHNPELFTAMILLAVLLTAKLTDSAGLSMALGAFLAGLLLAETEFRHQVESNILPFKGLLLGLFFMSVGTGIDVNQVIGEAVWLTIAVIGLVTLKAVIAGGLLVAFHVPKAIAVESALLLGEGGEFAFVAIGAAMALGVMPEAVGQFMLVVTGLSLALTPVLAALGRRAAAVIASREAGPRQGPGADDSGQLENHIVIAGFGRVGQMVAGIFDAHKVAYVAVDRNPGLVGEYRKNGVPISFGDASHGDILNLLGAGRAAAVIVTLDDPAESNRTVAALKSVWPALKVFARAKDSKHAAALVKSGVDIVVPEAIESSLQLASRALSALGIPEETATELVNRYREGKYREFRTPVPVAVAISSAVPVRDPTDSGPEVGG